MTGPEYALGGRQSKGDRSMFWDERPGDGTMALRLIPKRLVGQTVRGIRNRLGQTQEQFAESVGASGGEVVANWEEGRSQPDAGTLAKIAAMGLVDVLVFHDDTPADELPQLTPGEANELRGILSRMEALLAEAREIVEAAADRTVVEVLEAASSVRPPTPTALEADGAVTLAAEVTVKPRARKTAGESRSGGSSGSGSSRSRSGGGSTSRSSSSRSGGGSGSSGSKSSSGGSKSGSGRSGSSSGLPSSGSGSSGSFSSGSKSSSGSSSSGSRSSGSRSGGGSSGGSSSSKS